MVADKRVKNFRMMPAALWSQQFRFACPIDEYTHPIEQLNHGRLVTVAEYCEILQDIIATSPSDYKPRCYLERLKDAD